MKSQLKVAAVLAISLLWIQHSFCDEPSETYLNKWKCRCSSLQRNHEYSLYNCSQSCDCHYSDAADNESIWTCICDSNGFPKVAAGGHGSSCFKSCNCTWGIALLQKSFEDQVMNTLAFLASFLYYICRRDRCPIISPIILSDKETSYNSTSNLISHRTSSVPVSHIAGCFQKASFLFGSHRETFHGSIIRFSFSELENATGNFSTSNIIGLGGSSYVYRGRLKDGSSVAVKRLKDQGGPEADTEFFTEIELLSRLHHCHLVPLLGYCSELKGKNVHRLLVFEYMPNGNLRDRLDGVFGKNMDWSTRVNIALGAARGLEYLHEAAAPRILHRDVKSTNILLDENWHAKITDLGMAKNLIADDILSCPDSPERMQGTFGYFAPEYAIVGRASLESDVFSFGVVLLELISGRQPILRTSGREESLVIWATPLLQESRRVMAEFIDPRLRGNFPEEEVLVMAYLAKECLLLDPDSRPTMSEVVQILSSISPGKSRRRISIPLSLFQESEDAEKPRQSSSATFASCNFISQDTENNENKNVDAFSPEYMESLILLTSKIPEISWHASEEEMVDLTEPRFESFCVTSVEFP
ncbi:hypothetical protein PIB30_018206 [Stylosanthes scabra]|uniref:Protein kinase domain-containing protein n=1 Tax=Stylosanthes scabra TaxID=79078 RepID=A0ABU6T881_9FABA|nr:hypothetical protein [Stylosanthes scabra]